MAITPVRYVNNPDGKGDPKDPLVDGTLKDFFTGDSEGNVLYCDASVDPAEWQLKNIFRVRTVETTATGIPVWMFSAKDEPIALPLGFALGKRGENIRWLFGGTADLMGPRWENDPEAGQEGVQRQRGLRNSEQYIFGLDVKKLDLSPSYEASNPPPTLANLTKLEWRGTVDDSSLQSVIPDVNKGWRLRLAEKKPDIARPTNAEYASAAPFIYNGVLFVATFTPNYWLPTNLQDRCTNTGVGRLYALDPTTGNSMWKEGKVQSYDLENVKIVGISGSRGNLFLGIRPQAFDALNSFKKHAELEHIVHADGSIVELTRIPGGGNTTIELEPEIPHLQYWREMF